MQLKRRQFLFLGSFSAIGTGFLGWKLFGQNVGNSLLEPAIAANPAKKDLLLRFVSVADTGTGARGQYSVAKAMNFYHQKNPYNVVVLAGDNIYNNGEIEKINAVFERPYQPLLKKGVKFHACLGNHDIRTDNGVPQVKYAGFNMKGRYYTFGQDKIQFFALDTNGNADWKNQLVWLEKELSLSKADWKVVFGHHPIYSSGHYGSNSKFIKTFTPLFQKYNVQLYINGHEHNYERTRSINGTSYLTCGAGAGNRPVGRSEWTEYSTSNLSFATHDVYADRIEVNGIGVDNRVFDQGVIKLRSV
ncbi:metallophosphoesterase [Anabaena cylindrica FACHB-243]|uniref:Metallophosphoesterase n=1 Tax=Anabaena cylindrica (strain ATCC 27899 / PCC 7122) TaxID=272123 RepID=K9ZGF9_ANACC|nr:MULTISPECIES: metallophosphoesterase [Anabaena]AFZ58308.1 metallophosphoesterase [Anabaena cylindrica PCC 7122]MBD2416900.1 metallophosphoesterase [Anabaena cylindrica FACHB-243]MBY5281911.1 metallophosphoesterase [Anabaena sp. CCAP 1446/1C]MBY5308613.1 metallophosphoesterase [Anabaena sp. CCAP 1446/1C]MCM2406432.1 metallophosphoesterase [Anabaena sp. CCAP 1446/1C]